MRGQEPERSASDSQEAGPQQCRAPPDLFQRAGGRANRIQITSEIVAAAASCRSSTAGTWLASCAATSTRLSMLTRAGRPGSCLPTGANQSALSPPPLLPPSSQLSSFFSPQRFPATNTNIVKQVENSRPGDFASFATPGNGVIDHVMPAPCGVPLSPVILSPAGGPARPATQSRRRWRAPAGALVPLKCSSSSHTTKIDRRHLTQFSGSSLQGLLTGGRCGGGGRRRLTRRNGRDPPPSLQTGACAACAGKSGPD
jgi:hypothetical protein